MEVSVTPARETKGAKGEGEGGKRAEGMGNMLKAYHTFA